MKRWTGWTGACFVSLAIWVIVIWCLIALTGCQRGDIKVSPVIQGQVAPHDGYNIGPEIWVEQGDPAKVTGAVIWIKGTDPNEFFGE